MEDADEAVADLAKGGVVADVAGSELVVEGADFGVVEDRAGCLHVEGVDESVVVDEPGVDGAHLAGLAGDRAGAGVVLAGFGGGVAALGVSELGEHPGAEDDADAGLAEDDLSVRVPTKMGLDLALQGLDLAFQDGQDRDEGLYGGGVGGRGA